MKIIKALAENIRGNKQNMQSTKRKTQQLVSELFESKSLVYYPSDKDEYQFVQKEELLVMHEIDKDFDQDGAQIIQQRASAADVGPQETPCAG